jgi:quinol monooxygenase YgiN
MYAVCVELQVKPGQLEAFLPLMKANAAASMADEPGCVQFDVVQSEQDDHLILLYELYTDADAFQAHLGTAHFKSFDAAVADMLSDKSVHTGPRLTP